MEKTHTLPTSTIGQRIERIFRGDWWRITVLAVLCILMIAPLLMAFFISEDLPLMNVPHEK